MPTEIKKFKLDFPPVQTRRWNRSKHTSVLSKITTNPLHEAMKDTLRCRLSRASLGWVKQIFAILQVCQLTELKQTKEWERYPN